MSSKQENSSVALSNARLIQPRDFFLLAYLPIWTAIAWTVPERHWHALCLAWARVLMRLRRQRTNKQVDHIQRVIGGRHLSRSPSQIVAGLIANQHERRLQGMRHFRPDGWASPIDLVGLEHVERALAAGKGGLLWTMPFVFNEPMAKKAFRSAGLCVQAVQLPGHGFSDSRFATRFLNPIWTRVNHPLGQRIPLSPARRAQIFPELAMRLRRNELIQLMFFHFGRRREVVPLLSGSASVATGPPALAVRTGAALLPVFPARHEDGTLTVTIEAPLSVSADLDEREAIRSLIRDYVSLLEPRILRWPDQYEGWELAAGGGT